MKTIEQLAGESHIKTLGSDANNQMTYVVKAECLEAFAKAYMQYKLSALEPVAWKYEKATMWKDHNTRELVNKLTDVAKAYGQTQQLRDRISSAIQDYVAEAMKGQ